MINKPHKVITEVTLRSCPGCIHTDKPASSLPCKTCTKELLNFVSWRDGYRALVEDLEEIEMLSRKRI